MNFVNVAILFWFPGILLHVGIFQDFSDSFIFVSFILLVKRIFSNRKVDIKSTKLLALILFVNIILLTSLISPYIFHLDVNIKRFLGSCFALNTIFLLAFLNTSRHDRFSISSLISNSRKFSFYSLTLMLMIIVVSKIYEFNHYLAYTEMSHFALCGVPIFIYTFINLTSIYHRFFFLSLLIFIGLITPNTTTILIAALCVVTTLSFRNILLYSVLGYLVFILPIYINMDYFNSRFLAVLSSDSDNQNTSGLVYIQGWDFCFQLLRNGIFFGVGFQQMGNASVLFSDTSFMIEKIAGEFLSYKDGSFLFSKLFVEFGLFFLIFFSIILVKFCNLVGRMIIGKSNSMDSLLFASHIGFFFVLFVRGMGYFNFSVFWLLATFAYSKVTEVTITKLSHLRSKL